MKKYISALLVVSMMFSCLFAGAALAENQKIQVVTTIFPIYDWVREIAGDTGRVELTMLLDSGVDLHSYQPAVQDIVKVSTSDVFICVGGESDEWVEAVLETAANPALVIINLVEAMGDDIKLEETVEGMEPEEEEDEDDDGEEADEHVWLSLRNAEKLVPVIAAALAEADPDNADAYLANAAAYVEKLAALDAAYIQVVENAAFNTLLFGDRFPFRYLADDYGLTYYAAFSGCAAETEASFQTIVFLAQKVDELKLPAVLTIEKPKFRIAETIVENTQARNQLVLSMDSMQGTTTADVQASKTYLDVMERNLQVLRDALN